MKKLFAISLVVGALLTLAACGSKTTAHDIISKELGLHVSGGQEVLNINTYSGGEGTACIAVILDEDTVLTAIKSSAEWEPFPLDETVQTLVYGVEDGARREGPFLADENGNPVVPEIQNGYYLLIDRHSDANSNILERGSFNFTVGLYDTDSNTLYCCKLDT
ncbi:MAG TPA: hypothetical protein DIT49_03275 [Clostridiales bacterium]|nr:hypothetical protein [Clostridiales bacterium]